MEVIFQFRDSFGSEFSFTSIDSLDRFISSEASFWVEASRKISDEGKRNPHHYTNSHYSFSNVANVIANWKANCATWTDDVVIREQNNLNQTLHNVSSQWLSSEQPFTKIFVDLNFRHGPDVAGAFIDCLRQGDSLPNATSKNNFYGCVAAYEYLNQNSGLVHRSQSEEAAMEQLRERWRSNTSTLDIEFLDFKKELREWCSARDEAWDKWQKEAADSHGHNQDERKQGYEDFISSSRSKIEQLENTYREKLRLDAPAKYWKDASSKYRNEGMVCLLMLVVAIVCGILLFSNLFVEWLNGKEREIKLTTLQGVIIYGSALAAYGFLLRALAKLVFSSFHLMRDAEEREQLTYLYLSLSEDGKVDTSSRDIILQALFSRTETGLLNSESGPTMPSVLDAALRARAS